MPMQSMSIAGRYDQIPDEEYVVEDVTPLSSSTSTNVRQTKSSKCWVVFAVLLIIVSIVTYMALNIVKKVATKTVDIYQTSMMQKTTRLSLMTASDLSKIGLNVDSIGFGNTDCQSLKDECTRNSKASFSSLHIDSSVKYQTIIGFGGAFTEATALNFNKVPVDVQRKVIDKYFGKDGIGLSIGRIHINSCDFSPDSYTFDDIPNDFSLEYFDNEVTHDNAFIIPLILYAMETAEENGRPIRILASPWSPPAWMKKPVNGSKSSMLGSVTPNGLKDDPRVHESWALYISKFIAAYKNKGISIWAITPQNEPEFAAPWEACAFNSTGERDFINGFLGPTLNAYHPEVLILAYDHNKDHLKDWAETILGGDVKNYVDGMAFHWYGGGDRATDGTYGYDELNATFHYAPNKILLASEGCNCPGVNIDDWLRAERLAHDVMYDLQNYAQGWIDWNLLVDFNGGPNHLNNMCDAAMVLTADASDVHLQPKYYYFGHISKFVSPGSVRVYSNIVGDFAYADMDPNVQGNLEVAMFSCEKSTRQLWKINPENSTIELTTPSSDNWNHPGEVYRTTRLCVAQAWDIYRGVLRLVDCTYSDPNTFFIAAEVNNFSQIVDKATGKCISLEENVLEPGAVLKLKTCKDPEGAEKLTSQSFVVDALTGEIRSKALEELCMTAGWPFLNAVAFRTADSTPKTVIVVTNEAPAATSILLSDASATRKGPLGFIIDARSMETVVY